MPSTVGKIEWKIQAVGTGALADQMPIDLGVLQADVILDGTTFVHEEGFADRLGLALTAFQAVMNAPHASE